MKKGDEEKEIFRGQLELNAIISASIAACNTEKLRQKAEPATMYNVHQCSPSSSIFSPTRISSTHMQISCALLYNEETTPKLLNSMVFFYDLSQECSMCCMALHITSFGHNLNSI